MITWVDSGTSPPSPGHYAVHYCWEPEEGSFAEASYWDGKEWAEGLPIIQWSSEAFPTKEAAEKWIEANDPSW